MIIAIPTYQRYDNLLTLKLAEEIVGFDSVYVFFHTEEEKSNYLKNYSIKNTVVTGNPKGISGQRNSILNFFETGSEIVMLNDDIQNFYELREELVKLTPDEIRQKFSEAFTLCRKLNRFLWGIYPIKNDFYMKKKINSKAFVIGSTMGIINNVLRFDEDFHSKEDYDFTIQNIIKYGGIVRLDYLCCDAKHQEKTGGCSYVFKSHYKKDFARLLYKWENFVRINPRRKHEILLK